MSNGWCTERKARQSKMIRIWRPWEKSSGPKTSEGKARSAMRGYNGGHWKLPRELSRVLRMQEKLVKKLK